MPATPSPTRLTTDDDSEAESAAWDSDRSDSARGSSIGLGVIGSILICVGSLGAGGTLVHDPVLSNTMLGAWRYGHGKMLATVAIYLGVGLLALSWIRLGRAVHAGTVDTRRVLKAIAVWTAPLLIMPPIFTRDLYSYLAQGALANLGIDPYRAGPSTLPGTMSENVAWVWMDAPSPYGPLFITMMASIVAFTGHNLILGVLVTRLVLLAGLVLLCVGLRGLCRHLGAEPAKALWLGAANPLVLVHLVAGAHNDLLMVGLLAAGTLLVLGGAHVRGFAVVAIGVAIKAAAAVALPFLVWVWANRRTPTPGRLPGPRAFAGAAGRGVLIVAVVMAACTLLAGLDIGWVGVLGDNSIVDLWLSVPTAVGQLVSGIAGVFVNVDRGQVVGLLRLAGEVLLVEYLVKLWWRARTGGVPAIRTAVIALLATVLLSPVTLPWYFTWPLAIGAAIALPIGRTAVVAGVSIWLVLITFPNADTSLDNPAVVFVTAVAATLMAGSLVRKDFARWSIGWLRQRLTLRRAARTGAGSPVPVD